jgi:peptidyl-tRNA hydrolase, PTH1 family
MSNLRFLVVSLGNPAPYQDTLHSAGHIALNALQKLLTSEQPVFTPQRYGKKSCPASIGPKYILLQSPTYMNTCGPWTAKTWKDLIQLPDQPPESLILVHDDLEEELGVVKTRSWQRSHRGHNGLKSINASLSHGAYQNYLWAKISVGVGRPTSRNPEAVSDYVLRPITQHEKSVLENDVPSKILSHLQDLEEAWWKEKNVDPA